MSPRFFAYFSPLCLLVSTFLTSTILIFKVDIKRVLLLLSLTCVSFLSSASSVTPDFQRLELDSDWLNGAFESRGLVYGTQESWIQPIFVEHPQTLPVDTITDGIFNLIVDNQYRVSQAGEQQGYSHYAVQAISAKGLEYISQISVDIDPSYEHVVFHGIEVYRDGLTLDKTNDSRFSLDKTDNGNDLIYDGTLTAFWVVNDIRVGDVIEYSYTRYGQNPLFKDAFSASKNLQWSVPVQQQFYRVLWGKSNKLNIKVHHSEEPFTVTQLGDETDYQMHVKQLPPVNISQDAAAWFKPNVWAQVSETASWQQVINWAKPLFDKQTDTSDLLKAKIQEIKQQSHSLEQQVMQSLNFVQQDIRYLGLEMGLNSHLPSKASDTLLKRYGDCKDKSVLLISLLNGLGVDAYPALVNTESGQLLSDYLPSSNSFNHAIVKAIIDDKTYWLDPTLLYQDVSLSTLYQPDYGHALVLKQDEEQLTSMANDFSGSSISFDEHYDFTLGPEGAGELSTTVKYYGQKARTIKAQIVNNGVDDLAQQYAGYYDKRMNGVRIKQPLTIVRDSDLGSIAITEQYELPQAWQKDDQSFEVFIYESQVSNYLGVPESFSRRELQLSHPLKIDGKTQIKLRNLDWSFNKETVNESNRFFDFSYKVFFDQKLNTLHFDYHYISKIDRVEINQLDQYIEALKKVNNLDVYKIMDNANLTNDAAYKDDEAITSGLERENMMYILTGILFLLVIIYAFVSLLQESIPEYESIFYPVSSIKFFSLSFVTLGLYTAYWSYKNWQFVQSRERPDVWPVSRAIFCPLWYYALFSWLEIDSEQRDKRHWLIPSWLAFVLFSSFLIWSFASSRKELSMVDYIMPLIFFTPLLYYVNKINGKDSEAYQLHSKWHPRNVVVICCSLPLLLFVVGQDLGLSAKDEVIAGEDLWPQHIEFMQQHKLIEKTEIPILFYSDDWLDNYADGNGFTEKHVFSYWLESDQLKFESTDFNSIADIQVNDKDNDKRTQIIIVKHNGDEFILYATKTAAADKLFSKRLIEVWQRHHS
jgi:transglutaminase-like putative cysteine protease